jgi:hypothetical protein
MFLAGASYTDVAKRCQRSRSTVAAHGRRHKWEEQRQAIRVIRETVSVQQCLRYLTHSEEILVQYVEKLRVPEKLERVQEAKASLVE